MHPKIASYKQKSGWNALLPARRPMPALQSDIQVDVAIVGAGYTGIAAAKRWQELAPDDDIAIVDASEVGEGSPGRNSGFLLQIALANDADPRQMSRMAQCNELIQRAMAGIVTAVNDSPECQLQRAGTYRGVAGTNNRALEKYREFLEVADLPFEMLGRDEIERRLGTRFYREGLYSPHCYLAQPAALIRTLAQQLPESVQLFENTPAISMEQQGARWLVRTPEGNISARKVVLANNAFSKQLGVGKAQLVAMYTYAGLTQPLASGSLAGLGSDQNWGLLPAHRLGSTLRRTQDGRMLVRSFYSYEQEASEQNVRLELQRNLLRRFPQLGEIEFESVWGGAVGYTHGGGVLWGEQQPNLYVSGGCNGGGVVKGTLLGGLIAELANGRNDVDVPALFGRAAWMPPEPLRGLGFTLISAVERWRGRAEI